MSVHLWNATKYGDLAQLVEHLPYKQRVIGSSPIVPTICGNSSVGRALPCQGKCREFESRFPLHFIYGAIAKW